MRLIKRYKDSRGIVVGYKLQNGRKLTPEQAIALYYQGEISDVVVNNRGVFIAKRGYNIETVQLKTKPTRYRNSYGFEFLPNQPELQRYITSEFEYWYENEPTQVLYVEGARQVGKTYEIKRFCARHFKNIIYINLVIDTKFTDSLRSILTAENIKTGLTKFLQKQGVQLLDTEDTVIVLDEIQLCDKLYNLIRAFRLSFHKARVIVTGSYLGSLINKQGVFQPVGDVYPITMHPLSFKEFCLNMNTAFIDSEVTKQLYLVFRQIGGYPEVIKTYMQHSNNAGVLDLCRKKLGSIWTVFCRESMNYSVEFQDKNLLTHCIQSVLIWMCNEKIGIQKLIHADSNKNTDFVSIMINRMASLADITKKNVKSSLSWLSNSGVLHSCRLFNGEFTSLGWDYRYFVTDVGLLSYFLYDLNLNESTKNGFITENFVFNELCYNIEKIARGIPSSSYYKTGNAVYELDFAFLNFDGRMVGLEVKTTNGSGLSLEKYKQMKFIDMKIKLGLVHKHIDDKKLINYPVYLVGDIDTVALYKEAEEIVKKYETAKRLIFKGSLTVEEVAEKVGLEVRDIKSLLNKSKL